jgi:chromosome segregation ATPase
MGLKNLLFEQVEQKTPEYSELESECSTEDIEANVPEAENGIESIVQESYANNNLNDLTRSIFKVEDVINTLPKEMPSATIKTTVNSTLGVFGLSQEELITDGNNRINTLESVYEQVKTQLNDDIQVMENDIEKYKLQIANLEKNIANNKECLDKYLKDTTAEIERIDKLIEWIS